MKNKVQIIANHHTNLKLAIPVQGDNKKISDIELSSIIAWQIENFTSHEGEIAHYDPIPIAICDFGTGGNQIIYDTETNTWDSVMDCSGIGKDKLIESLNKRISQ